ncbi:MAG TPA: 50S ribosomal protein L21 [Beijerinckiaceae bacterium]|nr:50S ribosomal protein L21 [Beijerinckiaceae bacterium]
MFAVIKTGGKQYRVAAEDVITIARLEAEPGQAVTFDNVLMFSKEGTTRVGAPTVAGVSVSAEVVEQTRGPKVIAFKKRRRKNSRRKRGHRQDLTVVRILEILADGASPSARAAEPQAEAAPAPAQAEGAEKKPRARKKAEDEASAE